MFTKSFVSVYFLPDRVSVLQLSADKKRIVKHAQIVLPEGLIKNNKVQDPKSLAKVLLATWSKLGIREKTVGVVIPEFSTFTKYFKIPNLPVSDIDEAVRWQAQEYLPGSLESMILDWKITKRGSGEIDILVAAMDKEILSGYIKATEEAGLYPMKVEIPSICLLRYLKDEEGGVLLIYKNFGEVILVLSEGEKIVGTSIQRAGSFNDGLKIASKMMNHFSNVTVKKVFVAGDDFQNYLESVENTLKIKAVKLDPGISGLTGDEVQKNLIPLSLQFEDIEEPSSPTSLNLLPPVLVDKYKLERLRVQVWSLTLTVTLFVWISFFATLGSYLFMAQTLSDKKTAISENANISTDSGNPSDVVKSINSITQKVNNIKSASVSPQLILNSIYDAKTQNVTIKSYDLDLDKGVIKLSGISANRAALIQFKEELEKNKDFGNIDIPISSFEAETNLEFNISLSYLPISTTIKEKPRNVPKANEL